MKIKLTAREAQQLEAELIRQNLPVMVRKSLNTVDPNATYSHNWHIDLICDYLMAVTRREIKRLIINVPPRTLKSVCVNVAWPAWILGHDPTEKIISGSVTEPLAIKMSTDTRLVMKSDWYGRAFPETVLARDQSEKKKFKTTLQGERRAVSVGGKVIGEGGNVLIVDDPHDPEGTESDVQRRTALDWFDQAFSTRTNDPKNAVMVVIMQRLHQNDLTGHLLEKGGWEHVCLPAIAEERTTITYGRFKSNPVVREEGDILHPDRMPPEFIDERKITLGSYGFAGQFQQRPQPKGGGMLKEDWLKHYVKCDGTGMNRAILVDYAGSKVSERNPDPDYTAMIVVGLGADHNYYVLDIVRDRLSLTERCKKLFELRRRWTLGGVPPQFIGYEKNGANSDIEHIEAEMQRINFHFDITPMNNRNPLSKQQRIEKLQPLFEAKRIWLPDFGFIRTDAEGRTQDLVKSFVEEEYKPFPVGRHDDMLDALAQICDGDFDLDFPQFIEDFKPAEDGYDFEAASETTFMST